MNYQGTDAEKQADLAAIEYQNSLPRRSAKRESIMREMANHPPVPGRSSLARAKIIAAAAGCSVSYVQHVLQNARNEAIGEQKRKPEEQEQLSVICQKREEAFGAFEQDRKDLGTPTTIAFPSRWVVGKLTKEQTVIEIESLSRILVQGVQAVAGVFMRLCDIVRNSDLPDWVIRRELGKHFVSPRVSEIMRVSRAPDDVYLKYTAGFFGFKSALKQCRYYNVTPTNLLVQRQARRAAERLIALLPAEGGELRINGAVVTVSPAPPPA